MAPRNANETQRELKEEHLPKHPWRQLLVGGWQPPAVELEAAAIMQTETPRKGRIFYWRKKHVVFSGRDPFLERESIPPTPAYPP